MKDTFFVGEIKEIKKDGTNSILYLVNLFDEKVVKYFKSFNNANKFWKKHIQGIFDTNETNQSSIKYITKDRRIKYYVYLKADFDEIIEMEMSEVDFYESHKEFYRFADKSSRGINERFYSFHDIARFKTLLPKSIYYLMFCLNLITYIIILMFALFSFDVINMSSQFKVLLSDNNKTLNILSALIIISTLVIASISIVSCYFPFKKYSKNKNENNIEWNVEWKKRKIIKFCSIFVATLFVSCYIMYFKILNDSNIYSIQYKGITSIKMNYIIFILIGIIMFSIILISGIDIIKNYIWNKINFKKYYSPKEIKLFHNWIKSEHNDANYKKSIVFFKLPFEKNEKLILSFKNIKSTLYDNANRMEKDNFKKKYVIHNKNAIAKYIKEIQ